MAAALLVGGQKLPLQAAVPDEIYRFRPGVQTSRLFPLTNKQLQTILKRLRFCTGFTEMKFDETGRLDLGDRTNFAGGSATARSLIIAAVDSQDSFTLENRYQSPTVAFAQIEATDDYTDGNGRKHEGWQIRLDFFDFTTLRGGELSLDSFDPAMSLFHELAHGVLKLNDPVDASDPLGDCERHLNRIRAELGLPERQTYSPRNKLASTPESPARVLQGEVIFVQKKSERQEQKDFVVTFDLERVCGQVKVSLSSGCFRGALVATVRHRKR